MTNLPILYATLGALAGLPLGFGFAWCTDPKEIVAAVWRVMLACMSLSDDIDTFITQQAWAEAKGRV